MIFPPILILSLGLSSLAPVDDLYLRTAAEDAIAELKLVNMAVKRTRNPHVKQASEMMIREHTRQLGEIKALGTRFHVDLPTEPNALHKALYENLSQKKGKAFDKAFSGAQLQDHIGDVNTAQDESEVGVDPTLRAFAKRGVTFFARHEEMWRMVAPTVGVERTFGRPSAEQIIAGKKP